MQFGRPDFMPNVVPRLCQGGRTCSVVLATFRQRCIGGFVGRGFVLVRKLFAQRR